MSDAWYFCGSWYFCCCHYHFMGRGERRELCGVSQRPGCQVEAGRRDQRSGVSSCPLVRDRTSHNEVRIITRNKHLATWRASSVRQTTPFQVNTQARNIHSINFILRLSKTWEQRPQLLSPEIAPWGKLCHYFLVLYWGFVLVAVKLQWPNVLTYPGEDPDQHWEEVYAQRGERGLRFCGQDHWAEQRWATRDIN